MLASSSSSLDEVSSKSSHMLISPFFSLVFKNCFLSWLFSRFGHLDLKCLRLLHSSQAMELLSFYVLSWGILLEDFLHLNPLLFLQILWILWEMKASSSSSESSSDESFTLSALEELLKIYSLDNDFFLFFWLLRARDFSLLRPSSCWSSYSWTLRVPNSSSRDIRVKIL